MSIVAWAVVGKDGRICKDLFGDYLIGPSKRRMHLCCDRSIGERVVRVEVTIKERTEE